MNSTFEHLPVVEDTTDVSCQLINFNAHAACTTFQTCGSLHTYAAQLCCWNFATPLSTRHVHPTTDGTETSTRPRSRPCCVNIAKSSLTPMCCKAHMRQHGSAT
ncbi:hypothetical protein M405DRAFT_555754 [Rhizopogon salebrosus TDB-379]|nr:hypothetical protein M405DRAFT_555754 [Rhizopogon salebrosus TDB-379]